MRTMSVALVCAVLLVGGCSDQEPDVADLTPEPESVEPIDVEAASARYQAVCERTVDAGEVDACLDVVDRAIDDAVENGCSLLALDAYMEHGVAWGFESMPADGFFEECPLPLSNLMLPAGPAGYESADGAVAGTGLLSTGAVAERYADPAEVREWLVDLDHEVSYAASWADGDDIVMTRLDRFETIEGATAYGEFEPLADVDTDDGELITVTGVLQGRVVSSPGARTATGRVCDVAVNVHAQGDDSTMMDVDELVEFFSAQALRIQRVLTCETADTDDTEG